MIHFEFIRITIIIIIIIIILTNDNKNSNEIINNNFSDKIIIYKIKNKDNKLFISIYIKKTLRKRIDRVRNAMRCFLFYNLCIHYQISKLQT